MFQFCLGIPWGAENDGQTLDYLISRILKMQWSAFGIGRMQLVREVAKRGGNIRVGLEDNLYISKGVKATNEALVEEAKKIMKEYDLVPLTPAEAREKLNLKNNQGGK